MEELKKALAVVITVVEKTDEALIDNKITVAEGVGLAFSAIGLIKVVKDFAILKAEYEDLSQVQANELTEWFADEFDLRDDNLENIIEMIMSALIQLGEVFESLK